MQLNWSHAVLYVRDVDAMLGFYTDVLGFQITDRGPLGDGAPEIVFLSQSPDEHHQLAMVCARAETGPSNSVNHFAFRTERFDDVTRMYATLAELDGIKVAPLSHGNTLSIYFNDPEGNGLEIFWDTPWHVAQPQGKPWDPSLNESQALAWVQATFGAEPTFVPRQTYYDRRRRAAGLN
jgi:catechol-2,3-dioxygenase